MSNEPVAAPDDSLETIRHVTTVETELDAKVGQLRITVKSVLDAIQRETESVLLQTRVEVEREREATLATAQQDGDVEAHQILTEGTGKAEGIRGKTWAQLAPQKESILSAVLAEFRASGKRPSA
jgi:vacuolar-type H+-ATPase subunit H